MTAPPQSLADALPEPAKNAEPVRDELVEELRELIKPTAEAMLGFFAESPDVTVAHRVRDEGVRTEVVQRVTGDSDTLLSETNEQISVLRQARQALDAHETPPQQAAGQPDPRDKVAHALLGSALWLGVLVPVVVWQLLQTPLSPAAHFWVSAAVVVTGFTLLRPAYLAVARAGRRLNGEPALGGAGWPFLTGFATTYLLLILRLWPSSRESMGPFWAVIVWVALGLVAAFALFMVTAIGFMKLKDEPPGRRVPGPVVWRELLVTVAAAAILSPVFTAAGGEWTAWVVADVLCSLIAVFGGPLLLSSVPARLSRDPARFGSPAWTRRRDQLELARETASKEWTKAAVAQVEQSVRLHLAAVLDPPFSTELPELDRGALGQMRPGEQVFLDTDAARRLRSLLSGIRGGAVGMAGPRGVGKSTLLEAYQAGRFLDPNRVHIALLESVPVRYDAREFVLHLHSRMCEAVIRFCESEGAEVVDRPSRWSAVWPVLRRAWPFAAVVVAWVIVGLLGSLTLRSPQADLRTWLTANWWTLVTLLGVAGVATLARRRRGVSSPEPADVREQPGLEPGDVRALKAVAEGNLGRIRYQQKHTSGWSGKVGLPVGAEAGVSGSRETTRQPLTYPQIVHEFSAFLEVTVDCVRGLPQMATPSVVVILDELDKIVSAEAAQDFVNEIKAVLTFDVPGFLLLVSVSEDALASFERRGLPVRDAFDSTFDSIFRLEYLRLGDARQLLNRRVLGLPEPFVCLAHCLAGGLPRELIRVTRQVLGSAGQLADVAHRLVGEELRDKRAALRTVVGRDTFDDVAVSELVRHVDAHAVADGASLLTAAAQPPVTAAVTTETVALHRLQLETLGHLYYLGTVLEVFGPVFGPADLERGRGEGDASFDTLTSVRQLFPVNARLAWLTISAFRRAWNLPVVNPPDPHAAKSDNGA
ncbi:transcriptional regulator [Amycolatopsis sp. NPDC050768]|uniref:transcriptional regulator n=1 Tax=Amycolatopsis sp. NPDC050768 TaxID=3154839 RepID=UPI00340F2182